MISVYLPCYNAERYLDLSIQSILFQTYSSFELIIVDDGSTDKTVEIAERYQSKDRRIRIIKIKHAGVAEASNVAIKAAKYDWISRMDSDDIALPHKLETQLSFIRQNARVVLCSSYAYLINEKNEIVSLSTTGIDSEKVFLKLKKKSGFFNLINPTTLVKKAIALEAGLFNPEINREGYCYMDVDFWDRVARLGLILTVRQPLLLYRFCAGSESLTTFERCFGTLRYIRYRNAKPITFGNFIHRHKQKTLSEKIEYLGFCSYKKAVLFFSMKKYFSSALLFLISFLLHPSETSNGLWRARLSPEAKKWLSNAPSEVLAGPPSPSSS